MSNHRSYLASVRYLTRARYKMEAHYVQLPWVTLTMARAYRKRMRPRGYRVSIVKESTIHLAVS